MTPEQRILRARIAAHTLHSRVDPSEHTKPARRGFDQRFYDQADPDGTMTPEARERAAKHLRTIYFLKLAASSVAARGQTAARDARP